MMRQNRSLTVSGVVQEGSKRAGLLGFPTINIPLDSGEIAGIYAASVNIDGTAYPAAAFADPSRRILEAHIPDAAMDLYGKNVEIELRRKIRDSEIYPDDEALKKAIAADVAAVREYFNI